MEFSQGVPAKTGKFSERPINKDDIIYCIRLFKCFFCQVEEKNNEKIDSLKKLFGEILQETYEMLYKIQRVAFKTDDLIEDYAKLQMNIATNNSLSKLVISKLIDNRYAALLNETLTQVYKYE